MAFTVEDGTNVANANSYVDIAEADSYASDTGYEDWEDLSDAEKQIGLVRATHYIDQIYRTSFTGFQQSENQSLAWPRGGAYDENFYYFDTNEIPVRLKRAVIEMAFIAYDRDVDLYKFDPEYTGVKRTRFQVDTLSEEIEYSDGYAANVADRFSAAKVWLNGLVSIPGSQLRLELG